MLCKGFTNETWFDTSVVITVTTHEISVTFGSQQIFLHMITLPVKILIYRN